MSSSNGSGDLSTNLSTRSAGVKRLLKEAKELHKPTSLFYARPLEDNLFEWHFTFRGPPDTDYASGIYHGRIVLPHDYPMKPPNLLLLTENGRFETNTKICLSISGHHPETWLPSWSIRTAILALIAFFPSDSAGVGSLQCSSEARKRLAIKSLDFQCKTCGCTMRDVLPNADDETEEIATTTANTNSLEAGIPIDVNWETIDAPVPDDESTPTEDQQTVVAHSPRPPFLLYGFCLLACITGFLALLIRRLGS
ncbi:Ubiquitin--protein ligase [Aphelenchoides besseyi]|nr:Ubiquitin--protein ligase [Aphelenchoides besseyi]KAI6193718.1 Ubiquitin--protein ligase [Aphelenchoides besseyi]